MAEIPEMAGTWRSAKGADVRPGDRIRTADGTELTATRVEPGFFGRPDMIALIEDTPVRWFKRPVQADADVEILVTG
jgi:hypothetical protein